VTKYRLRISREVSEIVRHLPPQLKRKIKAAMRAIAADPDAAKPLKDELQGLSSRAVGRRRIILRIRQGIIEIVAVGHRRDIYERVADELSATLRRRRRQ
jgi:mRNA-degrading endonuclease RelE of RelBE toxin-antitoxin system